MAKFKVGNAVYARGYEEAYGVLAIEKIDTNVTSYNDGVWYDLIDSKGSVYCYHENNLYPAEEYQNEQWPRRINIILLDGTIVETDGDDVDADDDDAEWLYVTKGEENIASFVIANIAGWQYRKSEASKNLDFLREESRLTPGQVIPASPKDFVRGTYE